MLKFEELPLVELKEIGYDRKSLLDLGKNLEYLMLGKRTEVLQIQVASQSTGELKKYNGRLSVEENEEKSLNIHLVQEEFIRPFGVSEQQFKHLKSGKILKRNITSEAGETSSYLFQKDHETNELLKVKLEDINYSLTAEQLDDIQDGKPVDIGGTMISIDLSRPDGFAIAASPKISIDKTIPLNHKKNNETSLSR